MRIRLYVTVVLFLAVDINVAKHDPTTVIGAKEDTEAIFASVIKNITRVNHVLQELIKNYERLQEIYKSQENLESESSDAEIDEVYKTKKLKRKHHGRERSETDPSSPSTDKYRATEMIWSENSGNENNDFDSNSDTDTTEDSTIQTTVKTHTIEPVTQKKTEILFFDSHKSIEDKNKRKPNVDLIPIEVPKSEQKKTRYNKVSQAEPGLSHQTHRSKKKKVKSHKKPEHTEDKVKTSKETTTTEVNKKQSEQIRKVEQQLHAETFSPLSIWNEIINKKPIQLETHNELNYDKMRKHNMEKKKDQTDTIKQEPIAVENKNKTKGKANAILDSSDEAEDGKGGREEYQATILREAYGDACLKVVLKKCFKALKQVGKSVCQRFKCKENYKSKYNEYIKQSCICEFQDDNCDKNTIRTADTMSTGLALDKKLHTNTTAGQESKRALEDLDRKGYLQVCLPHLHAGTKRNGNAVEVIFKSNLDIPDNAVPNLNILRDKYERACTKIAHKKCISACGYAYTKTCETFTCNRSKKKAYKKECKTKCKMNFKSSHFSSSSSSNSESSSDSSSDSSDSS